MHSIINNYKFHIFAYILFPCSDFLEVYKSDVTFKTCSPENLDPHNINPKMQWTSSLTQNIGTNNQIVATLIVELDEFTKLLCISDNPKTLLLHDQFHICKEYLLEYQKSSLISIPK